MSPLDVFVSVFCEFTHAFFFGFLSPMASVVRDASIWAGKVFDSDNEHELTCFAKRVPQVKKGNSQSENNARSRIRTCLVKCLDFMLKNPDAAPEMWNSIECGDVISYHKEEKMEQLSPAKPAKSEEWKSFGSMKPTAKAWVYPAMPDLKDEVTAELLDKMNHQYPRAISDVFDYHYQVHRLDKIASEGQDPYVMLGGMKLRRQRIGDRAKGWFKACVDPETGRISWNKRPLFQVNCESEVVKSVLHTPSGKLGYAPAAYGEIRFETHDFLDSFNDFFACFQLKGVESTKTFVKDWFLQNEGPREFILDKKGQAMKKLFLEAKEEIVRLEKEAKSILPQDIQTADLLGGRSKRLREEALVKARASISHKKQRGDVAWGALPALANAPFDHAVAVAEEEEAVAEVEGAVAPGP